MAEGAFRAAAAEAGLDCEVNSAGTSDYHIGEPPDRRAIATAKAHGVDIAGHYGRQLSRDDFYRYTHIIALDKANLAGIDAVAPNNGTAKIAMLMDYVEGREGEAVKDPYYGDRSDFETVWEEVSLAAKGLVELLRS